MKKLIFAAMAVALLAGCARSTGYGECIGLGDEKKPELVYKVSVRNVVIGIIFAETVVVPVVVAVDEIYCPVDRK